MGITIIFGQMLVLLSMMAIGYFVYKSGRISEGAAKQLSGLVVNVFNPILVVNGVLGQNARSGMDKIWLNLLMIILYFVLLIAVSFLMPLLLKMGKERKTTCRLMTIFSNLGFMGIPVIRSIYGDGAMIYIAFYILAYNLLLYIYGMQLARKAAKEYSGAASKAADWRETVRQICNPGVAAALLAVLIFAVGVEVPEPVYTFCDYMGNATIPLSMILIGISVGQAELKAVFTELRIYFFILLRMVLLPILAALVFKQMVPDKMIFGIFIIELGMPVGSIVSMIIKEKGGDDKYCTNGVVLSTLASIFTIPVISLFL